MRDDELRPAVIVFLRVIERIEERLHVLAVDFLNVEAVGLEAHGRVFALGRRRRGVERDRVRIVNQDQIIETEMSGERARLGGHAFLQATVARETNAVLIEDAVLRRVESRRGHFHGYCNSDGIADALPERPRGALDSRRFKKFRVTRRFAVQLAEVF